MNKRIMIIATLLVLCLACGGLNLGSQTGFGKASVSPFPSMTASATSTPSLTPSYTASGAATLTPSVTPSATVRIEFGQRARVYMEGLAKGIGQRIDNTKGATKAVNYIKDQFSKMGYSPEVQPFTYTEYGGGKSANVIAVKKGLSDKQIIVGAHYDSTEDGGSLGADDNASGVALMMEAAERMADIDSPYTIKFIAFGAEEVDLLGSVYFVSQMSKEEKAHTIVMINIDSISVGNKLYIYGTVGKKGVVRDWALSEAKKLSLGLLDQPLFNPQTPGDDSDDLSDHAAFRKAGIQYVYFEATDWTLGDQDGWTQVDKQYGDQGEIWHSQYDTLGYIDKTFPGRIKEHLKIYSTLLMDILTHYRE